MTSDSYLQRMRVGGTSGVGTKLASVAGLFGSGWQAGAQVLAPCEVRDLDGIKVYSPMREHREEFAAEFAERVEPTVRAVDVAVAAVEGSDIVGTATVERADRIARTWSNQTRLTIHCSG